MLPDGVSYLDVVDKYLQQDWAWAINIYWSPLYSWLLAGALYLIRPLTVLGVSGCPSG